MLCERTGDMSRAKNTPMQEEAKKIVKMNLEKFMSIRGMSQVELSEKTGIPKQTINGYVKGTSLPTPGNTEKLSNAFNVSKDQIDPRFDSDSFKSYDLEEAKRKLGAEEYEFFEKLIEKTLSLDKRDRENFLENVRFAVEFFDKKNN